MQPRKDPAAGTHQPIVLGHRLLLHRQRHLGPPALVQGGGHRPVQVCHQRLELRRQPSPIEADGGRRRRRPLELKILEPRQRVLALPPQQIRLAGDPADDSDDLAATLLAEQPGRDRPDLDQLAAQCFHRTVAPRALRTVAGQLVDVDLVGLDHLLEARRDHPAEHLLQPRKVETCLALVEESLDLLVQSRRHLLFPGRHRGAQRPGQGLSLNYLLRCHVVLLFRVITFLHIPMLP